MAHKYQEQRVYEEIEKIKKDYDYSIERNKRKRREVLKKVTMVSGYAIIFLMVGVVYLNCVISKTKYNIKLEKLRTESSKLAFEVHNLKADTDSTLYNLGKIECAARDKFGMEISEDIRYVKVR